MSRSKKPFFSVVVPTRDRAEWLEKCIQAVLNQTFSDFEVLVVNNDTLGNRGSEKVVEVKQDGRIRHLRTGGLGMAANWQAGVEQALGEYIIICSDKLMILPWVLETAYHLLRSNNVDAVVWKIGDHTRFSDKAPEALNAAFVAGKDIMDSAAAGSWRLLWDAGARGMNCAFHHSYVGRVRDQLGVPLCRMICPDFNIALSLAALNSNQLYFKHVGSVFLPNADGNGMLCLLTSNRETLRDKFEFPDLDQLPVQYITPVTAICHDIILTNNLVPSEQRRPINWEMFFVNLIHEAIDVDDMGGFGAQRGNELLAAIVAKSLRFRLSLLKTIFHQELVNLIQGKRAFFFQFHRMLRLLYYPVRGLV